METSIARYLDAAILRPETTQSELVDALRQCIDLKVWSVCVRPCDVPVALDLCRGSETAVCVVLGFPHGCQLPESKQAEARAYLALGVAEIDMVANYGWARSGRWQEVRDDIAGVAALCRPAGVLLKVIFETSQLDLEQVRRLTAICVETGVDFVKTSTGFNGDGANEEVVRVMLETAAGRCRVKPSGGIRSAAQARAYLRMGAQRLGVNWATCAALCAGAAAGGDGY